MSLTEALSGNSRRFDRDRVEMNELPLKLDGNTLQRAQDLVVQFNAGNWKLPVMRTIPEGDPLELRQDTPLSGCKCGGPMNQERAG